MISLTAAVMLFINTHDFTLHKVYETYAACSMDLNSQTRDVVCIGQDTSAPATSIRPKRNPRYL